MSELAPRPGRADIQRLPGLRVAVTGTMAQVSLILGQLEDGGALAKVPPAPVPTGVPGQFLVTAQLTPLAQPAPPVEPEPEPVTSWWTPRRVVAIIGAGAVAVAAAIGAAAAFFLMSWIAAHLVTVVVIAAVLGLLGISGGHRAVTVIVKVIVR